VLNKGNAVNNKKIIDIFKNQNINPYFIFFLLYIFFILNDLLYIVLVKNIINGTNEK
jgi:hypothetical protein